MTDPDVDAGTPPEAAAGNGSASSFYDAAAPPFEDRPLQSTREELAARAATEPPAEATPVLGGQGPLRLALVAAALVAVLLLLRRRRRRA